ncbi:primosomal protein N' [Thiotrichales bacterium 19S3-7]|nr:primosomal protein N' [Thiotrichales bacterium 19S3-7]MCF6801134.1 primosomal protein N' [Thiotrichales bacterium 19S3-11]
MMTNIAEVIVIGPFKEGLDYLIPNHFKVEIGSRVLVPLRNKPVIGFIIHIKDESKFETKRLKSISKVIDEKAILDLSFLELAQWLRRYYHSTYYEVLQSMLPNLILKGDDLTSSESYWQINEPQLNTSQILPNHAKKQILAYQLLQQHPQGLSSCQLKEKGIDRQTLNKLQAKNLIQVLTKIKPLSLPVNTTPKLKPDFKPNNAQLAAIDQIKSSLQQYHTFLLDGVTGSGKTEVYLQVMDSILKQNQQILILTPEIGLTSQLVNRIERRFDAAVISYHSYLSDKVRLNHWLLVKENKVNIIVGTRSAVFLPFSKLGAIVVDEEHDPSYKQQSQLRYHGRDIAILRAKFSNIPVILGSATPSLESLYHANETKFTKLVLSRRAGASQPITPFLIDMRHNAVHCGLSQQLIDQMKHHLSYGNQVLLFLNRRGYAPILMCQDCGHISQCNRCDNPYTYHINPQRLSCHFCESTKPIITHCEQCQSNHLNLIGQGTERIEEYLSESFPEYKIIRIDRNTVTTEKALTNSFEQINNQNAQIIIGTQMMAKGHHFPNVTLVGILNIDAGLYSHDFRALERTGQLITQVAGRAGRAEKKGQVYLQTHTPDHPLLKILLNHGYHEFANALINERKMAQWPPFSNLSLIKGESFSESLLEQQMKQIKHHAQSICKHNQLIIGPFPAIRYKQQNRYRMILLVQSNTRLFMQYALASIESLLPRYNTHKLKLTLDIDPNDIL